MTDMTTGEAAEPEHAHPARRDFLFLMTGSVAAVGVAAVAWPFIDQMNPDAADRRRSGADRHRRDPDPARPAHRDALVVAAGVRRPPHAGNR